MFNKNIGWQFDNTYSKLSSTLITKINPTPVKSPKLILFNKSLAEEIDLNFNNVDEKKISMILSGNELPEGTDTISQAYAGHQFGHFTILGDGRAHIIGEHITHKNKRYDIQFKGSGKTPYSRTADGRAALGPMLREYIISEAMHYLNIPTTRSLAVVETGEQVIREKQLRGAILTRIASSHIRVGTFQYALISKEANDLKTLFNYTIKRHYPSIEEKESPAAELLKVVIDKQIQLICDWMRVGFIHGVMNTDNMTISGETIDYGPCAFMNIYDPNTVFSSIDLHGRYSYFNQPSVARWNLERFAESLLPLIDCDIEKSKKIAIDILSKFETKYKETWLNMMRAKLGLINKEPSDESLIIELLNWMQKNKVDYTNTFCFLMDELYYVDEIYKNTEFLTWKKKWDLRRKNFIDINDSIKLMKKANPLIIPRNHLVEEALKKASEKDDFKKLKQLLKILQEPYKQFEFISDYQKFPKKGFKNYKTFCGT